MSLYLGILMTALLARLFQTSPSRWVMTVWAVPVLFDSSIPYNYYIRWIDEVSKRLHALYQGLRVIRPGSPLRPSYPGLRLIFYGALFRSIHRYRPIWLGTRSLPLMARLFPYRSLAWLAINQWKVITWFQCPMWSHMLKKICKRTSSFSS